MRVECGKCGIEMACEGVDCNEMRELMYLFFCMKCGNEVWVIKEASE